MWPSNLSPNMTFAVTLSFSSIGQINSFSTLATNLKTGLKKKVELKVHIPKWQKNKNKKNTKQQQQQKTKTPPPWYPNLAMCVLYFESLNSCYDVLILKVIFDVLFAV